MNVIIPTPLRSYTGRREVEASGPTLAAVLADLDRQFPGIRFRMVDEQDKMRAHVRFFVNGEAVLDLSQPLRPTDRIVIVPALSGGCTPGPGAAGSAPPIIPAGGRPPRVRDPRDAAGRSTS